MSETSIEWTEATWNPVTGCSKVSPGCANCYAESIELRFKRSLKPWTPANAAENVKLWPERLEQPLRWARPRMIFVCSMADLFHELVPFEFIDRVFAAMASASHHTFQVLTKRPERMREWATRHDNELEVAGLRAEPWPNVWLGTTIENRRFVHRADLLRETPAAVRFVSAEPLLGPLLATHHLAVPPIDDEGDADPDEWPVVPFWSDQPGPGGPDELDLTSIDWLIAGGESGPKARPCDERWLRDLRDACAETGTAFFLKQLGTRLARTRGLKGKGGGDQATLDGELHHAMPSAQGSLL